MSVLEAIQGKVCHSFLHVLLTCSLLRSYRKAQVGMMKIGMSSKDTSSDLLLGNKSIYYSDKSTAYHWS